MKLLLSVLILAFAVSSSAQQQSQQSLDANLYYRALVATLDARVRDAKFANANDPLKQVIVQRDNQLNAGFPSQIGGVKLEYLTAGELRDRHRTLKHEFPVFVMRPIANEGDRLVVGFTRYWFTATKKSNNFALEGGYRVVLRYDCSQNNFVVESATLWGI
jgi:hypothetical protein